MKRRIAVAIIMTAMLGVVMAGCGNQKENGDEENTYIDTSAKVQQNETPTDDTAVDDMVTSDDSTNLEDTDSSSNDVVEETPNVTDDAFSFDKDICGTYKSGEEDEWEARYWDICNIDGKYYLDCISEYDFMAAEIELLDETPQLVGDEVRFDVKVYPFSGFAFAGEYQGAGQAMYISFNLDSASKEINLSSDNPFSNEAINMISVDDFNLHGIQDNCVTNQSVPEIIGAWRCNVADEENEYSLYLQFEENGCVTIVRKSEGYTPMVYRGIYELSENDNACIGTIEAEAIGMGSQPVADWTLEFHPESDYPIKIYDAYEEENPLVYGVDDMMFERTKSGECEQLIHPGPWTRTDEVVEMYNEYLMNCNT